jgi:hypothetical protein
MLCVTCKPFMLSVVMLNVIMLSVVAPLQEQVSCIIIDNITKVNFEFFKLFNGVIVKLNSGLKQEVNGRVSAVNTTLDGST